MKERIKNVKIVPREGSRKIGTNVVKRHYESLGHMERDEPSSEEPFLDERWSGTTQTEVPIFYHNIKMFPFKDPTDAKLERNLIDPFKQKEGFERLNEMAKRLRFKNDKGELIVSVDPFDQDDPLLTHDDFFIKLNAGSVDLNVEANILNNFMLLHLRAREEYQVGPEKNHPVMNRKVKYVIVDPDLEERLLIEQRNTRKEVFRVLDRLDKYSDKHKLAITLNLIDNHAIVKESTLDNLIENYAFDTKSIAYNLITKQEHFLEVLKQDSKLTDAHYLFSLGKNKGLIKYNNNNYIAFGEILGSDTKIAIENLALETNKDLFSRLYTASQMGLALQSLDSNLTEDQKESISKHKEILKDTYEDKLDTESKKNK